jgi:hypothetical protein
MQQRDESSCSCNLGEGEWGDSGWHFYRVTVDSFVRSAILYEQSHRNGRPFSEADRARCRQEATERAPHYVRQPVAFAPCPMYRSVVADAIANDRRESAAHSPQANRLRVHA